MGPVSFEPYELDGGRDHAMRAAAKLSDAGLRFQLVEDGESFRLLLRGEEASRARAILAGLKPILMQPLDSPPDVTVRVPGSKSHTNRALICAALAEGTSTLRGALFAEDTVAMIAALGDLGVGVETDEANASIQVTGTAGNLRPGPATLHVRQSGTTGRFLLPLLTLGVGSYILDGDRQLRSRPFGDLISALSTLGASIDGDRLPLEVQASGLEGGSVAVKGSVSSQFLSGLLLSSPCARRPVELVVEGQLVSKPYIELTLSTMSSFGASYDRDDFGRFSVQPTGYRASDVEIEPDASAASYFFGAAAITGGRVRILGLGSDTVQGDMAFVDVLADMGCEVEQGTTVDGQSFTQVRGPRQLKGVEVDMTDFSDTAQTLSIVATFASTPTTLRGIGFIRNKETDRVSAIATELGRLGIAVEQLDDSLTIHPGPASPGRVETYDDHRMAMSFALLGLQHPGIEIAEPGCVAKTFPDFFTAIGQLG